ncbi:MAG: response regulator transcription factor [Hahellaceae bacterium]|nr:response regulator transcription factor [Hahellaceae bacterium]
MASEPKVYVVEDDEAVRDSLMIMLRAADYPVEGFSSADDFLAQWSEQCRGCLVLDIRMPGMDGMTLQKELNHRQSLLPIIFVTGHGDVPLAVEAMKEGAVDFIQKPYAERTLLQKIDQAMGIDAEQQQVLQELQSIKERLATLTDREREVMQMMVEGKANKVIAIDLDISQRTVEIHRARVMQKMGTHSLAHLVRMVLAADQGSALA